MSEELGSAVLELGTDNAPLDAGLKRAEARTAQSVAVMQAMLDSLHIDIDAKAAALDALLSKAGQLKSSAGAISPVQQQSQGTHGSAGNEIWGIRGPQRPGSLTNPMVMVLEAAKYTPMGSYAASVGEGNVQDAENQQSGLATSAEMAALAAAVRDLASRTSSGAKVALAGESGLARTTPEKVVVSLDDPEANALRDTVAALARIEGQLQKGVPQAQRGPVVVPMGDGRAQTATRSAGATTIDSSKTTINEGGGTTIVSPPSGGGGGTTFVGVPGGGGSSPTRVIVAGSSGAGQTFAAGPQGQQTVRIDGAQYAGLISAMAARGGGGGGGINIFQPSSGGGGGNKRVDVFYHASGGGGGGGGGAGLGGALLTGAGAGLFGLPAAGSIASLAGLGAEHVIITGLGILGSAASALGGAGLLGLGAAGTLGVGAGSDLGILKSTISDTQLLSQDYATLANNIAVYGKNSQQAHQASAQLNADIKTLGNTAGVQAELGLGKYTSNLNALFDATSSPERVQAVNILMQVVKQGYTFLPLFEQAALTNLTYINSAIKPLMNFIGGPSGTGIFQNLEDIFRKNLPAGMKLFTNSVELVLRVMNQAAPFVGGFTQKFADLFAKWNSASNGQLEGFVSRLVGDFKLWEHFVSLLARDIADLFHADQGTGNNIISTLTGMLQKLHDWENSVTGQTQLMTIFEVHKKEADALLGIIPVLAKAFGTLYMTVSPALVRALTAAATAITDIASAIESIPGGAMALGLGLVLNRLGALGPAMRLLTGGGAAAAAGGAAAAAGGGAAAAEGAGGAAAAGGIFGRIAASSIGRAIAGGVTGAAATGAVTAEVAGATGLASALTAAGVAMAPIAAVGLPLLAAAGGTAGLIELINLFGSSQAPSTTYNSNQLAQLLRQRGTGALRASANPGSDQSSAPMTLGGVQVTPGAGGPTIKDIGNTKAAQAALVDYEKEMRSTGDVAKMSMTQLQGMVREGKALADIFPQYATSIDKFEKEAQATLSPLQDAIKTITDRWNTDGRAGLGTLVSVFTSNMALIQNKVGGFQGKQLMAQNVQSMVDALTKGMQDGRISVANGMSELNSTLNAGLQDGAIHWTTKWQDMFSTVQSLYDSGKINARQYTADLHTIMVGGFTRIADDSGSAVRQMNQHLVQLFQQGNDGMVVTRAELNKQMQTKDAQMNAQAGKDMVLYAANIAQGVAGAGNTATTGFNDILSTLNKALKELGQKPVSPVTLVNQEPTVNAQKALGSGTGASSVFGAVTPPLAGGPLTGGAAQGALWQIGQPGQAGRDSVPMNVGGTPIMVAPGEQVAVFNRHQLPIVNSALSEYGGLQGMFDQVDTPNYMAGGGPVKTKGSGGIASPSAIGAGGIGSLVAGALGMLTAAAKKDVGSTKQAIGAKGGVSSAGLSGTLLQIVHQIAGRLGWGAGQVQDWLQVINRESGGSMTAQNPTSSAYGIAQFIDGPSEYAQYGGNVNTMSGQLTAMANYIKGRYGNPGGAWSHELSAGWYASGGLVQPDIMFAGAGGSGTVGADTTKINSLMYQINSLVGSQGNAGDVGSIAEKLSYYPQSWAISNPLLGQGASSYIVTTDALGNNIMPYIDQASVALSTGQLNQELGWEGTSITDIQQANKLALTGKPEITKAISTRNTLIAKAKAAIEAAKRSAASQSKKVKIDYTASVKKRKADYAASVKKEKAAYHAKVKAQRTQYAKEVQYVKTTNAAAAKKIRDDAHAAVVQIQAKIRANLQQIQAYQKQITSLNNKISTEQGKKKPNYASIGSWNKQINNLNQKITDLQNENQRLGGNQDSVGSGGEIGGITGNRDGELTKLANQQASDLGQLSHDNSVILGRLGTDDKQTLAKLLTGENRGLAKLASGEKAELSGIAATLRTTTGSFTTGEIDPAQSQLKTLQSQFSEVSGLPLTLEGATGLGGMLGPDLLQQSTLQSQLGQLSTSSLAAALAAAVNTFNQNQPAAATPATNPNVDTINQLYQQVAAQNAQAYAVSQAQYEVMSKFNLPPFGGSFAQGGTVPGPPGAARTIIAHGGEEVFSHGGWAGGGEVHVHIHGKPGMPLHDLIDYRIEQSNRNTARTVKRALPSRGGGQFVAGR